jgi:acetylornithine deacetylase/succinyl-diaminopimelate desuccinylase-like protein
MLRRSIVTSALVLAGLLVAAPQPRAQSPAQMPTPGASGQPSANSSAIVQIATEATSWLQDLIRINTSNPPGNELAAAKYLAGVLNKEGIPNEIFESAPGRGILVARLSANPQPDPSRALLLMGHLDVVGVDRAKWTVDPFAGIIQGNYLYGRGAIDDKGMAIADLAVMVELKRTAVRLNRDVIFLAEGDEEDGGAQGIRFAIQKHWDKIASGFALNEGGEVEMKDGKVLYVGVQASEKVSASVDVIATGTSGHASIPLKDNPVAHVAAAVAKIAAYQAPVQFNSVTRAYFAALAPIEDEDTGKWMRVLDTSDRGDHAARVIADENPQWNAMMRDTISPTMLSAGVRNNVIPPDAKAVLNIRLLPGDSLDPLLAKLKALVDDPEIRFELEPNASESTPSSSLTSDLYNSITRVTGREFPGVPVAPYLSTWATDSSFLRMRNVQAYGLVPFPLTDDDLKRMHANDERIPLDSFRKGVEYLYNVVTDFAAQK